MPLKALILVDIQNDFVPGGSLAVPNGDQVISIANELIPQYSLAVATQDWHPSNHGSFASNHPNQTIGDTIDLNGMPQILWPDHCIQQTQGAEFCSDLNTQAIQHVVPKGQNSKVDSYSGFFDNGPPETRKTTGLENLLREHGVEAVDIIGLATDYCVKATAIDAANLGFTTTLIQRGCQGVNIQPNDCQQALQAMQNAGVQIK